MPVEITLPGGETVEVNDSFADLPDLKKRELVGRIAKARGVELRPVSPPPAAPTPTAAPHEQGTNGGLLDTLQAGVAGAGKGLSATARVAGFPDVAKTIDKYTPDAPKNYRDPAQGVRDSWNKGDYLGVAGELGRTAVQGLPDMAAALAAAGIGGTAAGPAGAFIGPAAYTAARSFGENVDTRQENNHTTGQAPTSREMVAGGLTTGVQAALAAAGLKIPRVERMAPGVGRSLWRVAGEGASNAAQDVVGQFGNTAGTEKGVNIDLAQTAIAAGQGALTRGATQIPGAVARTVGATGERIGDALAPKINDIDHAASIDRVNRQIAATKAGSERPLTDVQAANSSITSLANQLTEVGRSLRGSGEISGPEYNSTFDPLVDQARRHNQGIDTGDWTAVSRLRDLNLPDDVKRRVLTLASDIDLLSQAGRDNRSSGPFSSALGAVGSLGSIAAGSMMGGAWGAGNATAGALMGHSLGGRIGKGVGHMVDSATGQLAPDVVRQARVAARMLRKEGVDPGPIPAETVMGLRAEAGKSTREKMGLSAEPEAPPTGIHDPATGKPFTDVVAAATHAAEKGENVLIQGPDDIRPIVMEASQAQRVLDGLDTPNRQSDGYFLNRFKTWAKEQRKTAADQTKAEGDAATAAMRDQETLDAQATKRDAQKAREQGAAWKKNEDDKRATEMAAQVRATAFAASEREAQRSRTADETAAGRTMDAQARDEAAAARQTAAQTRGEIGTRQADLAAALAEATRLDRVRQKDATSTDRALTRNERAADWVSGVDFRQRRRAESEADQFARTGGREGNPAGASDPLMVRADGSPVDTPRAAPRKAAGAPVASSGSPVAADPVKAAQTVSAASGGGAGGILMVPKWLSWIRDNLERGGADPKLATYPEVIAAAHEAADRGLIPRDFADKMETFHGGIKANRDNPMSDPMHLVVGRLLERNGQGHLLRQVDAAQAAGDSLPPAAARAAAATAAGIEPTTIRDKPKWFAAREDVKQHVEKQASVAESRENWPALADTIRKIGAETEAKAKERVAREFLASLSRTSKVADERFATAERLTIKDKVLMKGVKK